MLDVESNTAYVFVIPADGTNHITRAICSRAGTDEETGIEES